MTTTLLAIDDSKTMRKVLEITFSGDTYKVLLAENVQQALEKLRSERPALALLDANLGSAGGGYDLCQQIKREAPSVGVLVLSSKQVPYDKARGASVGADEFMDKPFDTQQLLDKTAALLRRLAEQPAAAARPAAPAPAAPAPSPAPSPRPPLVQPRPTAPSLGTAGTGTRPHVQTLVGGAPVVPSPAPAPAPAPAPVAARPAAPAAAPVVAAAVAQAGNGQFADRLAGLGLSKEQVDGVLSLSREIVEKVVWEVVPTLAETIIREEIRRLTAE